MSGFAGLRDVPIRRKLILLALLSSALGLALAATSLITLTWNSTYAGAIRDLKTLTRIVADNTTATLAFSDALGATETLTALKAKPEMESACLYQSVTGGGSRLFAHFARAGVTCPPTAPPDLLAESGEILSALASVDLTGERIGTLYVTQNLQSLRQALVTQVAIAIGVFIVCFLISMIFAGFMQRAITRPILRLAAAAQRVSETRDYHLRVDAGGQDEIGRLIEDFNRMLGYIEARDREIQNARDALSGEVQQKTRANQELEQTLKQLRDAQAMLVQSEKMASLGALVAGVAHEINTPVGIGVTAASTLEARAQKLKQMYETGTLTRSELERFVALADESCRLILRNLQRAADLIQGFKQVAVDQSSSERRRVYLKAYLDEVLMSLGPKLKQTRHRLAISCPNDLSVDSYPGALAQIVTNFINNSLLHGYDDGVAGQLRIEVSQRDGWVTLIYRDDGRGIPPEHQDKVFDPFFTTRRGTGGSGLGMHIVYNLVTQMLGGTIQLNSTVGKGVEFVIRFPSALQQEAGVVQKEIRSPALAPGAATA